MKEEESDAYGDIMKNKIQQIRINILNAKGYIDSAYKKLEDLEETL